MAEGNGVDQGAIVEMLKNVVASVGRIEYRLEREFSMLRQDVSDIQRTLGRHERDMLDLRQVTSNLQQAVNTVQQDVRAYHGSVAGHGMLISELDERVRRLEARV